MLLKFDVPGAGAVPESEQGTLPFAINFWGRLQGGFKIPIMSGTALLGFHDGYVSRAKISSH
jgi:hypothetical protein